MFSHTSVWITCMLDSHSLKASVLLSKNTQNTGRIYLKGGVLESNNLDS